MLFAENEHKKEKHSNDTALMLVVDPPSTKNRIS